MGAGVWAWLWEVVRGHDYLSVVEGGGIQDGDGV